MQRPAGGGLVLVHPRVERQQRRDLDHEHRRELRRPLGSERAGDFDRTIGVGAPDIGTSSRLYDMPRPLAAGRLNAVLRRRRDQR